jgi:hypothetical protein
MAMQVGWAVFLAVSAPAAMAGPEAASKAEPQELAESFLEQVGRGEVDKALESLPKASPWASQPQKTEILRGQIKMGISLYGPYLGIERVRESRYSPSMTRLTYLMKFEQHFLVWNISFYKPKERWLLAAVAFLDQTSALE